MRFSGHDSSKKKGTTNLPRNRSQLATFHEPIDRAQKKPHLVRKVRDPDEHHLEEPDVRPENDRHEHQPADRAEVVRYDARREQTRPDAEERRDRDHAERGAEARREHVEPEHARRTAGLERHQPVERGERQRERDHEEADGTKLPLAPDVRRRRIGEADRVGLAEVRGEHRPHAEVEERPREEEAGVVPGALVVERLAQVFGELRGRRTPRVHERERRGDREEQQHEERRRAGDGDEHAPERPPPERAGDVEDHQENQRGQDGRNAEAVRRDVGDGGALRLEEPVDDRQRGRDEPDDEWGGRCLSSSPVSWRASLESFADGGGSSPTGACWLIWSAWT